MNSYTKSRLERRWDKNASFQGPPLVYAASAATYLCIGQSNQMGRIILVYVYTHTKQFGVMTRQKSYFMCTHPSVGFPLPTIPFAALRNFRMRCTFGM